MAEKILLDTDICLDALTDREPFSKNAQYLLYLSESSQVEAYVSSISFSNMFYLISIWNNVNQAFLLLSKLRKIISIADVTKDEIDKGLTAKWNDFEESLQYYTALRHKCTCIITRNTSDYIKSELPIISPSEFLEQKQ